MEIFFTNAEKIEIFSHAIAEIQYDISRIKTHPYSLVGLCWHLSKASKKVNSECGSGVGYDMKRYFPELYKMKPKKPYSNSYWFSITKKGMERRIVLLEKAIKKLNEL